MEAEPLTPLTESCLESAGWFPGRRVPTSKFEMQITEMGYPLLQPAIDFLTEFGGLNVVYPAKHYDGIPDTTDTLVLEPRYGTGIRAVDTESVLREPICPLGDVYTHHMALIIGASGRFYGVYDEYVVVFGATPTEALNSICEERSKPQIGVQWTNVWPGRS